MVDDARKRIQAFDTELEILARETDVGHDHAARVPRRSRRPSPRRPTGSRVSKRRGLKEKELVDQLLETRAKLRGPSGTEPVEPAGDEADAGPAAPEGEALTDGGA